MRKRNRIEPQHSENYVSRVFSTPRAIFLIFDRYWYFCGFRTLFLKNCCGCPEFDSRKNMMLAVTFIMHLRENKSWPSHRFVAVARYILLSVSDLCTMYEHHHIHTKKNVLAYTTFGSPILICTPMFSPSSDIVPSALPRTSEPSSIHIRVDVGDTPVAIN